jgi:hypothetical protein
MEHGWQGEEQQGERGKISLPEHKDSLTQTGKADD